MPATLAHEIAGLTLEHVVLVAIALFAASLLGIPTGIFLTRKEAFRGAVLGFTNVVQLYALLPILRNTLTGILGVDPAVVESAVAMGMTDRQRLFQVELPLAAPTIFAGVRVATVTTIGTATIAAAIGGGGLGVFIFRGLASVDSSQILAGAVPAALLALAADGGLGWIERRFAWR